MKHTVMKQIATALIITILSGLFLENTTFENFTVKEVKAEEIVQEEATTIEQSGEEITTDIQDGEIETSTSEEPTSEEPTSDEPTTEEPTTEEPTTEEPTTPEYIIIDDVYKIKDGILVEYLGDKNDESVISLEIPKEVQVIDANLFLGFKYITEVSFETGSQLIEIGEAAFKDCESLSKVTLPDGLKKIGYRAFGRCMSLKSLKIPSTVTEGNTIFGTVNAVTEVTFKKGMTAIPNTILKYANSVEKVTMYSGVTSIGKQAFYGCKTLKTIELPKTVTVLNTSAFNGCESLESIDLKNVTTIGVNVFKNCKSLKVIVLKKIVKSIGVGAFDGIDITLQLYANSYGKAYARKNNIKWEYTASEIKRRAKNQEIYDTFKSNLSIKDTSKFKLKYLKNYVPQGTCLLGKYLIVSMYHKNLSKNSILLLYNKSTGAFVKKIVLPSKDHVGSITNVEGRLVIGLCDISATDYVAVINKKRLYNAKAGKKIKYNYTRKLTGYADFAAYDGKYFWAGRSANISTAKMYGYKVKIKKKKLVFTKKYSFTVPKNTQGLIVKKGKSTNRTFIFSQSYGRLNNSALITYKAKLKTATSLGEPLSTKVLPSMIEGICMNSKGKIFMVFESGAGLYCGNPDNTSEIQIKNVCKIKESKLEKLK